MTSVDEDVPTVARCVLSWCLLVVVTPHLAVAAWNTQGCVGRISIT